MKKEISFYSEGCRMAGDLYLPEGAGPHPGIVLCHGFAGIKGILLPPFAEAFARAGFAALVFDYRGFGQSEGERGRLVYTDQVRDIRNALTFMQTLPDVDGERLGLWGTSYGGANAVTCAAQDRRVKALAVQLTFASGERVILGPLDAAGREKLAGTLAKVWAKTVTQNKSLHLSPEQILTDEQSKAFFNRQLETHPEVQVKIPLLFLQYTLEHNPERLLPEVRVPLLIIAAENDQVNPPAESEALFAQAREPKALHVLKGATHYECYTGEPFQEASQKALDWFDRYLK